MDAREGRATSRAGSGVSIIRDPADSIASGAPVQWAVGQVQATLAARGLPVRLHERIDQAPPGDLCLLAAGPGASMAHAVLDTLGLSLPDAPESLVMTRTTVGSRSVLLAEGRDVRGLVYALLEVADRVAHAREPQAALELPHPIVERPANPIRSVARLFVSEVEDKPWFYDRSFWQRYLSMLAAQRFNRFSLMLGMGYNWAANPGGNYTVEGLTAENHAAYCRDALQTLLQACPAIQGVTFRIHGESRVPEAHYDVWRKVFDGIVQCGRRVEIDMHAKGIDAAMIDIALATGMPVNISPKYWAEHMGLPYQQASIRALELPPRDRQDEGFFARSSGSRRFGSVSPLDPELFSSIEELAEELMEGPRSGKYSPVDVAHWLEELASGAMRHLAVAETQIRDHPLLRARSHPGLARRNDPAFRRLAVDVAIQCGLGRFFAGKLRAAVLYALYTRSGHPMALREAVRTYRAARAAWAELSAKAEGVYVRDITFGRVAHLRGHWKDRLEAIDQDLADLEALTAAPETHDAHATRKHGVERAIHAVLAHLRRPEQPCQHAVPPPFRPGQPVVIEATLPDLPDHARRGSVLLHYRRVDQSEPYHVEEMQAHEHRYRATIPGDYTDSPYPLQYFFELRDARGHAWLYPGFDVDLCNQPYYVVRQAQ